MSKTEYVVPEMSIVAWENADVIATSPNYTEEDVLIGD